MTSPPTQPTLDLSPSHPRSDAAPVRHDTSYGTAALELLARRVDAVKADDPLRPVTVVVATNTVGITVRRHLGARGAGVVGLHVLTVRRLAELVGAPPLAASGRRPLSTPVVAAAVRRELADDPLVFAPVADHPATVESLVRVHRELDDVSDTGLDRLAATGPRPSDVVALHRRVRTRLSDGFYDDVDLFASATSRLATSGVTADLGTVVVFLPQRLSRDAAGLLATLGERVPLEVVVAWVGEDDADRDVVRTLDRLGVPTVGDRPATPLPSRTTGGEGCRVVTVSDQDEEARAAVDAVVAAARDGVPFERIAILLPTPVPYARLVHEALDEAGIERNGTGPRSLADRRVGRWVLDLLEQSVGRRDRAAVMDLLLATLAPTADTYAGSASSWLAASREAGIVAGTDEWTSRLAGLLADRASRGRWTGDVEGLREAVGDLFDLLDTLASADTWSRLAATVHGAVADWLGDPSERDRWPAVERDAADRVAAALDRLAGLDDVEPRVDVVDFRRTLELELETDLGRVGRFGHGVHVAPITGALGLDLDLVVVVGLAEGVFPTHPGEDSLLLDHERQVVGDELPARRELVGTQHRLLRIALAAAPRQVLVVPRGDLRTNAERVPCRWVADVVPRDAVEVHPSFAHRVTTAAFPSGARVARLRELADESGAGRVGTSTRLYGADPALRAVTDLVEARRGPAPSRYDGWIPDVTCLPSLVGDDVVVFPTHLEGYLSCPHAAFVVRVLGVREVDNPEERLAISALDRGSLVHDILEEWLRERLEEPLPDPDQPWSDHARHRLHEIAEEQLEDARTRGLTGHRLLWERDRLRILHELDHFLDADDRRRADEGLVPVAAEQAFGFRDDPDSAAEVVLPDGRVLRVAGKVDRVDRDRDGRHVVADYKTGSARGYAGLDDPDADPVANGLRLQLATYALGVAGSDARDVRAEYWFTSDRGGWGRIGYVVDDHVVRRLAVAAGRAVTMWESGLFTPLPTSPDDGKPWVDCAVCDPDGLGTADVHRRWTRLARRPELRELVRVHDPELADLLDAEEEDA